MAMNIISRIVLTVLLLWSVAYGQDVYESFYEALQNEDMVQMVSLIRQIQASGDNSPERYIAEFNYYYQVSDKSEGPIHLDPELPENEDVSVWYALRDSLGNVSGYIYGLARYDQTLADSGIAIIDQGLELYPYRLDMCLGKIYALGTYKRWDAYYNEIMSMLDYTETHHDSWEYPFDDEPLDNLIMNNVLSYEKKLIEQYEKRKESNVRDVVIMRYIRDIATKMMQVYPGEKYFMNIMAVSFNMEEDYGNALEWLKMAESIDPDDEIVLLNIADTYYNLGNRAKDKKYLRKLLKSDDPDTRDYAKRMLKLRK